MAALADSATQRERNFAYLDFDVANHREKMSRAAAFVHATDTRYGWSSKDLRALGGSELRRLPDMYAIDHDWAHKGSITTRPPAPGCRVVVELFPSEAPLACENFLRLCKGQEPANGQCGKPLCYRGSNVHRVETGFVIQGGDFVFGNGSGGESVFGGKKFKDEKGGLALKHARAGVLSMGNSGKNANSSQFFFTLSACPQLDGRHVVFGRVVSGYEVLKFVEAQSGSASGAPSTPVQITDCGAWQQHTSAVAAKAMSATSPPKINGGGGGSPPPLNNSNVAVGQGWWLDVPDEDAFGGSVPRFFHRPRVAVVAPSQAVGDRFVHAISAAAGCVASAGGGGGGGVGGGEGRGPTVTVLVVASTCEEPSSSAEGSLKREDGVLTDDGVSASSSSTMSTTKEVAAMIRDAAAFDFAVVAPACAVFMRCPTGTGTTTSPSTAAGESSNRLAVCKPTVDALQDCLGGAWWSALDGWGY